MTKEMAKVETKEMARTMDKGMMGEMEKETSRRRPRTMMIIIVTRVLEKTMVKTHLLMRMCETNEENMSRITCMHVRRKNMIKRLI